MEIPSDDIEHLVIEASKSVIDQNIFSLSIEFEFDQFMFFKNTNGVVRYIRGKKDEYSMLQSLVRKGKAGSDVLAIQYLSKEGEEDQQKEPDSSHQDTTLLIYNSFFRPISYLKNTFSNAELYLKPFEAPGGDFYWMKKYSNKTLIVVGDCTGHGMQGALISMSLVTLLKQYFKLPPSNVNDCLYEFYDLMNDLLEDENDGGFDAELGLIIFDNETKQVSCAGSGIDMIFKKSTEIEHYKSSRRAVSNKKLIKYENDLNSGDQIFIFSDGITDQFDKDDKKLLGMRGLLGLIDELPSDVTLSHFMSAFNKFRGKTESYDDQTMMILTV